MSDFYIQKELLSSSSRTVIKDQQGKPKYLLVGRWGARGDVLSLYAMSGEVVAKIVQTSFSFSSRFELYAGYEKVGTLQRILSINRDFYYIHQLKWVVMGDIKNQHYTISKKNRLIMTMSKAYLLTGDYCVLSLAEDANAPLCICIAAVLDYWIIRRKPLWQQLRQRKRQLNWEQG